jgi:hypothetical protein
LLFAAMLVVAASGCKSNPYCLNCKDSGNGVITPEDMTPSVVDGGDDGMVTGPDLLGSGGPCVPTNGGIEVCDGLDNDCNGAIDDVSQDRLIGDPKNCGACGNECKFTHAFGQCVGGFDGGMPTCKENGCQPGYVDLDGDPSNGCEYVCTPTTPATEICDGKDNNCDGQVDEGFTTTWFDAGHSQPKYDSLLADCGQCGTVCNLGEGTVMACQGTGTNGRGQCAVVACFNGNDAQGMHQTYRHNPVAGPIATTGCEYHCPLPASTTGNDCDPNGACTFPAEVCNGLDDDCNFVSDDSPTDPGLNQPCADGVLGEYCDVSTCGKGACKRGTLLCQGGGVQCTGSVGPSPEVCDGLDNNCDGKVDEPYTATWQDVANSMPRYDLDTNNCGGCGAAFKCALPNAINKCRVFAGDATGSCAVAACNPNFYYVAATGTGNACNTTPAPGPEDSHNGPPKVTGVGCYYSCTPTGGEICDGKDNDCNGCKDDGLTAPPICNDTGLCKNNHSVSCDPSKGWICTYGAGVDVDGMGNLTPTEAECDNLDNNCNGACDESFPDVPVTGVGCTNAPKTAKACSGGQGACLLSGAYACNAAKTGEACRTGATVIGPNGDLTKASDEVCDGKDNDCNGLIDEATDYTPTGSATTFHGWHDPVAVLTVGADPFNTDPVLTSHQVWVYAYEASRPDATGSNPGSSSSRACANAGTLPWANVTLKQAQSACAAITDSTGAAGRVCTAWEWQQACNGNLAASSHWSMSASTASYVAKVCNDSAQTDQRCAPVTSVSCPKACNAQNKCTCSADVDCPGATAGSCVSGVCNNVAVCTSQCLKSCNASGQCACTADTDCNAGFTCNSNVCTGSGAWPTGSIGSAGAANQCYADFSASGKAHDMTGNLQEWTSTIVYVKQGAGATMTASSGGTSTIGGLANILSSDVGAQIVISGSTKGNNGTYDIVGATPTTSVTVTAGSAVADSALTWKLIYNKIRGGNFTTTTSGGDTCEFDFDIQKASFANTDVGFRCCFDHAP